MVVGMIIIYVILALLYLGGPLWLKIVVMIVNSFFPDPIPVVDEVLMVVGVIKRLKKIGFGIRMFEWIRRHKIITVLLVIVLILLIIVLMSLILNWLFS